MTFEAVFSSLRGCFDFKIFKRLPSSWFILIQIQLDCLFYTVPFNSVSNPKKWFFWIVLELIYKKRLKKAVSSGLFNARLRSHCVKDSQKRLCDTSYYCTFIQSVPSKTCVVSAWTQSEDQKYYIQDLVHEEFKKKPEDESSLCIIIFVLVCVQYPAFIYIYFK